MRGAAYPLAFCLLASAFRFEACAGNPAADTPVLAANASRGTGAGNDDHRRLVQAFGGEYGSPELKRYVGSVGRFLVSTSEMPNLAFTFTILNSPLVNAFAVPGGYVYVTRGLLALANDEAELAAVLAHEIGHITARHGERRRDHNVLATIGLLGVSILGKGRFDDFARLGATGLLRSFSREDEHEADLLAIRYLTRAGYDPGAMSRFLAALRASSRLDARRQGKSPDSVDRFSYLATHPAPSVRVDRASRLAATKRVREPITGRDVYFSKVSGILVGDDPRQGYVRGRDFLHPVLRFAFRVPGGFSMFNSARAVVAIGPRQARILFDRAAKPFRGAMSGYIRRVWAPDAHLSRLRETRINGLPAAVARTRLRTPEGALDARLAAYRMPDGTIYRMLFLTPSGRGHAAAIDDTIRSVRRLTHAEAARLRPYRLKIVAVRPGDTVRSLAHRQPYGDHRLERFLVMNGLTANARLRPGGKIKLVVEER